MKIYKANKKGHITYLLLAIVIVNIVIALFQKEAIADNPLIIVILLIPVFLFFWIYYDTSYAIDDKYLIYRSGFIRGKVEIRSITEIDCGKTLWSGLKPALATNGLIIRFNTFDEIYIAPEDNNLLITDL